MSANTQAWVRCAPEIAPLEHSIGRLLEDVADERPQQLALIHHIGVGRVGRTWTYAALRSEIRRVANALAQRFEPGDRIATWASGKPEMVLLFLGATAAGMTLVTFNPACRREELRYLLEQSQARGLFMDRSFRGEDNQAVIRALRDGSPSLQYVVEFEAWSDFIAGGVETALPSVSADAPALICFTSGTTGKPKGVVLRHRSVVNNARAAAHRFGVPAGSVWLNLLPMFHIGGTVTNTLGCLANHGTQVLLPDFDADATLDAIQTHRVAIFMAVPTMLVRMLHSPAASSTDYSSVQVACTGGATVPPELVRQVRERMRVAVQVMFGQTEAGGCMTLTRPGDDEEKLCNTVGAVLGGGELRVVRPNDGGTAAVDEIGEICVRSPYVMAEYFRMPERTAETLDPQGWVHTGDLGFVRADGYVQVTGRLKDMIIRGGENIYPREIEDQLCAHACVRQAAVFGVPDEQWGEQVAAAIVVNPGAAFDARELSAYLRDRIARYKVPRKWIVVDELPLNSSGKVQKFLLQDSYQQLRASGKVIDIA